MMDGYTRARKEKVANVHQYDSYTAVPIGIQFTHLLEEVCLAFDMGSAATGRRIGLEYSGDGLTATLRY